MVDQKNQTFNDYKLAIIVGGVGALLFLILVFAIGMPLYNGMKQSSAELKDKKAQAEALNTKLENLKTLSAKEADLQAQNQKVLSALPADTDVSRLFVQLENIGNQNGMSISSVSGGSGPTGTTTASAPSGSLTPVTYTVTGTVKNYSSLKATLAKIETALRVLSVSKVDVSGSGGNLTVTFNVTTYVRGTAK